MSSPRLSCSSNYSKVSRFASSCVVDRGPVDVDAQIDSRILGKGSPLCALATASLLTRQDLKHAAPKVSQRWPYTGSGSRCRAERVDKQKLCLNFLATAESANFPLQLGTGCWEPPIAFFCLQAAVGGTEEGSYRVRQRRRMLGD